jgi:hypothetical protein
MEKFKKISIMLVLSMLMMGIAFAVIMQQKSITNNMTLNASYDFALYETGTTTPVTTIEWDGFNDGETKEYIIDLKYLGNVQGRIYWDGALPSGWTLTIKEKNHDANTYNDWLSGVSNQITGLDYGHLKNVKLILTETTATPLTPYTFTVTFYSVG